MNEQGLKALENLGAELGAAKAEVERLREALRPFAAFEAVRSKQGGCTPKRGTAWAVASAGEEAEITVEHLQAAVSALSQQADPVECPVCCSDEPHTGTCGSSDPRALCNRAEAEPATAQDEREVAAVIGFYEGEREPRLLSWNVLPNGEHRLYTRPAQTEQQPVCWASSAALAKLQNGRNNSPCVLTDGPAEFNDTPLYAIAQTVPQPEQTAPEGYVLLPKQCPSWLEDAYDECCEADQHFEPGLYLPAYDAMVAALSAQGAGDADS